MTDDKKIDPCGGCPEKPKYPNFDNNYPCPLKSGNVTYVEKEEKDNGYN